MHGAPHAAPLPPRRAQGTKPTFNTEYTNTATITSTPGGAALDSDSATVALSGCCLPTQVLVRKGTKARCQKKSCSRLKFRNTGARGGGRGGRARAGGGGGRGGGAGGGRSMRSVRSRAGSARARARRACARAARTERSRCGGRDPAPAAAPHARPAAPPAARSARLDDRQVQLQGGLRAPRS